MNITSKIKTKYTSLSLPLRASVWFTIANFLQRGISMITTPIFTRLLPKSEYGIASTFIAWQNVLVLIVTLSLYKAMMNLFKETDNYDAVASSSTNLSIFVSSIWVVFGIIFSDFFSKIFGLSKTLTVWLFLSFIPIAIINCWTVLKRYRYDYMPCIIQSVITTIGSSIIAIVAVLFFNATAESKTIPTIVFNIVAAVIVYLGMMKKEPKIYDKRVWTFSLSFCVALLPHYLSEFILQSSDKLMINSMCGSEDTAIYSIAYSVGSLITLVTSAVNSSIIPYRYQRLQDKNYKQLAKVSNQVLGLVALMLIGLMVVSPEVILVFGGDKYIAARDLVIPICIGVFFNFVFQLFSTVQEYYESKNTVVIASILCAATNIILNYIFINKYGYQAAAYTTFVCYLMFSILHYLFYRKVCREKLNGIQVYDIKGVVAISCFVLVIGVVTKVIIQYFVVRYVVAAIILLVVLLFLKKMSKRRSES